MGKKKRTRRPVTKYPAAWNGSRRMIRDVTKPVMPHDWEVKRPFWVCRACNRKVDGSIVGSRVAIFSNCPCAAEARVVLS